MQYYKYDITLSHSTKIDLTTHPHHKQMIKPDTLHAQKKSTVPDIDHSTRQHSAEVLHDLQIKLILQGEVSGIQAPL